MALKIQNQDVADERGLINSEFNSYQTVPTSISHQNFFTIGINTNDDWRIGGGAGILWQDTGVKIADGMLYIAAPRYSDHGRLFVFNIEKDLIPNLSGSNYRLDSPNPTTEIINQNATNGMEMFTVWDAGHGLVATVKRVGNPSGESDGVLRVFRTVATYDGSNATGPLPTNSPSSSPDYGSRIEEEVWTKTFSDTSYSIHTSIRAIAIGNGRIYVAWRGEGYTTQPVWRWHFTILDLEGTQISDTILDSGTGLSTLICDMDANHGYVLLAKYEDDALLYTADGKYLDALEGSSFRCKINCNRFVVTQKGVSKKFKMWDYARKFIADDFGDTFGHSCYLGEELLIVGSQYGDPVTGAGTLSNAGEWQVYDLDGNVRTDYGQSGDFWAFGLATPNDRFGSSVAIGDGIMAIGGYNYIDNDTSYNNSNGTAALGRPGCVLIFKIPTTLSNYYEKQIHNYRY